MRADNAYALPPRESKEEFVFRKNLPMWKVVPDHIQSR